MPPAALTLREWRSARPLQLLAVLGVHRRGGGDPTFRTGADGAVVRGIQTPEGPATVEYHCAPRDAQVRVQAWGAGAQWALEQAPAALGEGDAADGFVAHHPQVAAAARRFAGWRVPASGLVLDALVPAIIEQRVTGKEAFGAYRRLVQRHGEPAPGPWADAGLVVPPGPRGWRGIPSWEWLRAQVDPGRSGTVMRVCALGSSLERLTRRTPAEARAALRTVTGVGQWTAAEVAHRALGDADAVSFGDYHVARSIGWALTGVELDDAGLAELLQPYAGHRYRVQRLLELSGAAHPRHAPRMALPTHLPR